MYYKLIDVFFANYFLDIGVQKFWLQRDFDGEDRPWKTGLVETSLALLWTD